MTSKIIVALLACLAALTASAQPIPPAIERGLEELADPKSDEERVGRALIAELEKLPEDERHRYDDRLSEAMERRLFPTRFPRAYELVGDGREMSKQVMGWLEELLTDSAPLERELQFLPDRLETGFAGDVHKLAARGRKLLRERMIAALPGLPWATRMRLTLALFFLGDPEAGSKLLVEDLSSRDEPRRFLAATLLTYTKLLDLAEPLRAAAKDVSPRVRCSALEGLGMLGTRQALPEVRRALKDLATFTNPASAQFPDLPPISVSECALHALGRLGGRDEVPDLVGLLAHPRIGEAACAALRELRVHVLLADCPDACDEKSWLTWLANQKASPPPIRTGDGARAPGPGRN